MEEERIDENRRHFLASITAFLAGIGIVTSGIPLFASWLPSEKARALGGPVEVDISSLNPGQLMIAEWRGKPIWIVRRTQEMLDSLSKNQDDLRDPDSLVEQQPAYAHNRYRSINPEYLVLIGICTHLGCSPTFRPDLGGLGPKWRGGFYCPCHGSKFDLAGRVMKGVPAPINLEVPPYKFLNQTTLLIGEDQPGAKNG